MDSTGRLQQGQNSQGTAPDSGFRFYVHKGVGGVSGNALAGVVEDERSRSMAMGAFFTNRAAAFTIGDAAASTMPKEVWNQYYGSYLQRTDAFMWMGYMAGGLEGALANENTTLTLFGVALGGLAAPVAAEGIIAGGLVAGNGVIGAATWTMTQANNIRAVGVSVYLMSRQPGAYQAFNQFAEEGMALVSGYDGPSLSPVGFADDVISGVRRSLNSVADGVMTLDASAIRFSQSNVRRTLPAVSESMKSNGWQDGPIDVVRMSDGGLTAVDNTRLAAASLSSTPVQAVIRGFDESFPSNRAGGNLQGATWGEAVSNRIGEQTGGWRRLYPNGSQFTGVNKEMPGFTP